ncbi:hypothetical protein ELQ17_02060 [Campylobacter sp. US18a]|nr:hypothetical protein ELQ17_02060 [Campylobacter sp. US18a]
MVKPRPPKERNKRKFIFKKGEYYVCINKNLKYDYGKVYKFLNYGRNYKHHVFEKVDTTFNSYNYEEQLGKKIVTSLINVKNARLLWIWEIKHYNNNTILRTSKRYSYREVINEFLSIEYARPIYNLGFILRSDEGNLDLDGFFKITKN